ncbi:MAG: VacJ family lipoprotein [Deltaproteobacteria bacterium]|nr:VacJ family lipoprotein [Deltaproteobacteria bacterium]
MQSERFGSNRLSAPAAARDALVALVLLALLLSSGCAHPTSRNDWSTYTGPGKAYFVQEELEFPDVPDPLEPTNRGVAAFNRGLMVYVADPVATAWRRVVPQPVRSSLFRAFENLGYPARLVNNLLQAKFRGAGDETLRFLSNTTLGLVGLFDPARSWWGIQPSDEDMGQTFATWGWHNSTFLSLPLFGPSTARDGLGTLGDMPLDPTFYFFPAGAAKTLVTGSEQIDDAKRMLQTHFDAYQAIRYIWVLNRRVLTEDYEYEPAQSSAPETLENVFFTFQDPWFGRKAKTRKVEIPATGRKLAYEVWMQPQPAPMVFILPGLGAHRESKNALALAEMAFRDGFSAVTVSSALNFDFMENAATTDVPGFPPADASDVHAALDAIDRDLADRYPDRITSRVLMGMSMGAFHTLFIAAAEQDTAVERVDFDRYVALYPPVRFEPGMKELDAFYNAPLAFPEQEREDRVIGILQKVVDLAGDHDLEPGNPIPLSDLEAEFLIGLSFRMTLHDMIWVSQERHDMGVLKTPRGRFRRAPASREILEFSFMEYLYAFALPYYQQRDPEITSAEELFARADLRSIAPALRSNGKIQVFSNANDFLMTPEDIEWITDLLGAENVTFYPKGGHMGNLHLPEVQRDVMNSLGDLQ